MPTSKTLAVFDALAGRPPGSAFAQIDLRNAVVVLDFDDAAVESIDFVGVLPRGYAGRDFEIVVTWAATSATSGAVVWQVEFERHSIADPTNGTHDLDANDFGTPSTNTGATAASSGELVRTSISLEVSDASEPIAGESYRLRVSRAATSGSDTMTGDAELVAVELREV